ncbi:hypothetical protein MBLNU459_g5778t2 [Dothideomycetes sp. NU459]
MPSALKPAQDRNTLERSPHPYARRREQVSQDDSRATLSRVTASGQDSQSDSHVWDDSDRRRSHAASSATSESGTEADDERPHLLKALPPALLKPRKGLKQNDGTATPLLTPSQLDQDGRSFSHSYFEARRPGTRSQSPKEEDVLAARQLFEKRKRAERIRRISEGALLGLIGLIVMSGPYVCRALWTWHRVEGNDSDTENELDYITPMKLTTKPRLKIISSVEADDVHEPRSAVMPSQKEAIEPTPNLDFSTKRRHTFAGVDGVSPFLSNNPGGLAKRRHKRFRTWYLDLTAEEALVRKNSYAAFIYAAIAFIIALPVRRNVSTHALQAVEPVLWALDYLFGGVAATYTSHDTFRDAILGYLQTIQEGMLQQLFGDAFSFSELRDSIGTANTRLIIFAYWLLVLSVGIITVLRLTPFIEVDTRRKVFHAIMVTMLLPATFVDPCFCAFTLSLVLAVFLLLEVIRAGQVPPLGTAISRFVAPYVDGRDLKGPMVVSHVFLLIGCAIPLWLSLAGLGRDRTGWDTPDGIREVAMVAGVVCVGMGDAAASLIGRRFGRRKWPWIGGKSLEGSAAFAVAVCIGLMATKIWLRIGKWHEADENARLDLGYWVVQIAKTLFCGCGASFMEAVLTGANDNVVVPVALWLLVRGVGI